LNCGREHPSGQCRVSRVRCYTCNQEGHVAYMCGRQERGGDSNRRAQSPSPRAGLERRE
jgi:hypothetical protein